MSLLAELHTEVDARVEAIRKQRPDWLCGKGCDSCCRRLAEMPRLTAAEWDLLRDGLAAVSAERLQAIQVRMSILAEQGSGPVICPLLDEGLGACSVYVQRPVACRTYGFYVERDLGLYCAEIESRVAAEMLAGVVWGNHATIDQRLIGLGETRPLTAWFAEMRN